ncbi:MAG: plasmid mobilization relaxosome protein MobC [Nitrospira sp.]|nr:MAG: plasmid mobilization relaxosome protein MobC [Nitrospira sp.]
MALRPNCLTSRVYCMLPPMHSSSRDKRTTTITVDLGELKAPWQAYCAQQGVTPSHALRQVVRQALDGRATPSAPHRLRVTRRREGATARMKLNVTPSELAALKKMAGHEGYQPTAWVVAMIRTKLTGEPHVGQPELAALTRSNQQLLALGRNLNQIAKVLNTSPENRGAFRVEVITELSRVIRTHTDRVSDVLRGTVARWSLQ